MACRYRRGTAAHRITLRCFLAYQKERILTCRLWLQLKVVLEQDHERCPPHLCPRVPRGPRNMRKEQTGGGR
jgi:hypothetical protein